MPKIQFRKESTVAQISICQGGYNRTFVREEQPFELSDDPVLADFERRFIPTHDYLEIVDESAEPGEANKAATTAETEPSVATDAAETASTETAVPKVLDVTIRNTVSEAEATEASVSSPLNTPTTAAVSAPTGKKKN